jgi:hypothetical protein
MCGQNECELMGGTARKETRRVRSLQMVHSLHFQCVLCEDSRIVGILCELRGGSLRRGMVFQEGVSECSRCQWYRLTLSSRAGQDSARRIAYWHIVLVFLATVTARMSLITGCKPVRLAVRIRRAKSLQRMCEHQCTQGSRSLNSNWRLCTA